MKDENFEQSLFRKMLKGYHLGFLFSDPTNLCRPHRPVMRFFPNSAKSPPSFFFDLTYSYLTI